MATSKLPDEIRKRVFGENVIEDSEFETIFNQFMKPILESQSPEDQANQGRLFINLDKVPDKKWPKPKRHKLKQLSYKERRKLGLYSIDRNSIKYSDLLPLHTLWKNYIKTYVNFTELYDKRNSNDGSFECLAVKLYRADYHGANLLVKRSTCPGYVGVEGIVAMETKNCFLLVGKDNITRTIPKCNCEFYFEVDGFKFLFYGKNFISRPADRSSKKIKTIHVPHL